MRELDRQQQDDERERRGNGSDGGSDHERDRRPRRRADDANDEEQRPRRDNPRTTLRRHRPDSTVIDLASLQANSSPNPRPPASAATSANPAAVANYSMGGYMQYPGMYGAGIFPGQMPIVGPTQPKNRSANQREESSDPNVSSTQMTTPQFAHMPGYPMNMPYFHPAMWMAAQQNMSPMPPIPAAFKQNGSTSQPTDMPTAASMPVSPTLNSDSHRQPHGRSSADNSRRRRMHESIRPDQDISSDFRPDSYFPPELADTSRRRDDTSDDLPPSYQFVADQQLRNAAR
ncbi:hypothetical protein H4R24_004467 [Coemansia sp. RSA 988]|nr:hypothetical protein H4R24_004467 [Coemansia sp. RSA 988]